MCWVTGNLVTLLPVYKGKGDPLEFRSYKAIKLLEHSMKECWRRGWQFVESSSVSCLGKVQLMQFSLCDRSKKSIWRSRNLCILHLLICRRHLTGFSERSCELGSEKLEVCEWLVNAALAPTYGVMGWPRHPVTAVAGWQPPRLGYITYCK